MRSPDLEQLGLVEAIVTQNVDGLHQRAGSADVLEVHGSIRTAICLGCGATRSGSTVCRSCSRCRVASAVRF